jgi:hypothetical protein
MSQLVRDLRTNGSKSRRESVEPAAGDGLAGSAAKSLDRLERVVEGPGVVEEVVQFGPARRTRQDGGGRRTPCGSSAPSDAKSATSASCCPAASASSSPTAREAGPRNRLRHPAGSRWLDDRPRAGSRDRVDGRSGVAAASPGRARLGDAAPWAFGTPRALRRRRQLRSLGFQSSETGGGQNLRTYGRCPANLSNISGSVRSSAIRRENSGRLCDSGYDPRLTSAQAHASLLEQGEPYDSGLISSSSFRTLGIISSNGAVRSYASRSNALACYCEPPLGSLGPPSAPSSGRTVAGLTTRARFRTQGRFKVAMGRPMLLLVPYRW